MSQTKGPNLAHNPAMSAIERIVNCQDRLAMDI